MLTEAVTPSGDKRGVNSDAAGNLRQVPANLSAKGYQQITSLATAASLTIPSGAIMALINIESQSIRWRDDGVNPTASVGMPMSAGEEKFFTGSLSGFRIIEIAAGAKLNISYYG